MKKKIVIIVGGSGQFGITLTKSLLKKKQKVILTTRNIRAAKKKIKFSNKYLTIIKLNVLSFRSVNNLIKFIKPNKIFYFAGQSSPVISFKKGEETLLSNFKGCENFLLSLKKNNLNCKFINASSSEIFAETNKKINIYSKKLPISPYGKAKYLSYKLTKNYREIENIRAYNAVIFNTESLYRDKNYLIPKICIAAINAYKYQKTTAFGNLNISREWNWCEEQVKYLIKFSDKRPQDFLLSNGKCYSAKEMLVYAFNFFDLNYRKFVKKSNNFVRRKDFKSKRSNYIDCLKRNRIKRVSKIYGEKLVIKLIKYYLNN